MARDTIDTTPLDTKDALMAYLAAGSKPAAQHKIGTEHEKFPFYKATHTPVPYEGAKGVRKLLVGMEWLLGWEPIMEGEHIIGLYDVTGGGAISLEPGGQFELSGAPLNTLHETATETAAHLAQVREIASPLGIGFLSLGMSPQWSLAETPMMPKGRYEIMKNYMPKVGADGLNMMFRTSTVQVNLDFSSEQDMVKKLQMSLALQPIATAIFANSPFTEAKPNGYLSRRSHIWLDTDKARSGMLPFAFEQGMGFERYVDYALDVPMYFVKRGERYIDVTGASFRDLLAGNLKALPGEKAVLSDWVNHLSTIFPEVRLKKYLEMRGADTGPLSRIIAFSALWAGLFYDEAALDAAHALTQGWSAQERQQLREDVPRLGFKATIKGRSVQELAKEMLALSRAGLQRRNRLNAKGQDESLYLEALTIFVESGKTPAEQLLARYHGAWGGAISPVFEENAY
jgi:glutamate--cysteine ligase